MGFRVVNSLVNCGYRFIKSTARPRFYLFGKTVYDLHFMFHPTNEKIQEWINRFELLEDYESASLWTEVLKNKNKMGLT